MRLSPAAASVAAFLFLMPTARAWDDFGHMEVAAVAWPRVNAKARKEIARLLKLNPRYGGWIIGAAKADEDRAAFLRAGTWADAIKHDPAYSDDKGTTAAQNLGYADRARHGTWHYVDRPYSPDGTPTKEAAVPNAATQIPILRAALAGASTPDDVRSYDLVWLLHLVPDIHQPLHCVSRYDRGTPDGDRGGNLTLIAGNIQSAPCDDGQYCPLGPPPKLHIFLDTITGQGYAWAPAEAAALRLPKADPAMAKILDVEAWVAEGFTLARTAVYVAPIGAGRGPHTITPAYQKAMRELAERRMALAGARLANLLNDALGK